MTEEAKPIPLDDSPEGVEAVGNPSQDDTQGVQKTEEKVTGTIEDGAKGEMAAKEEAQIEEDKGEVDAKEEIEVEESAGEAKPGEKEEKAEEAGTEVVEEKVEEKAEAEEKAEEETAEKGEPEKKDAPEEVVEAGTEEVVEEERSEKEEAEIGGAEVADVGESAGEEPTAEDKSEGEVDVKEVAQVKEGAGEAKPEDKESQVEEEEKRVLEGKSEERTEAEGLTEEETAEKGESGEGEAVTEEGREGKESEEEETVVADEKTAPESKVAEEGGEVKTAEEETEEDPAAEEGAVAAGREEEEAGLVLSKELSGGTDGDITDEEWINWKKEFLNKFKKRFNNKRLLYGTGAFMLVAGLVVLLMGSNLRFTDTREVKSLAEIAGPVYDMKFFLPLDAGASKTRFVKVTVAIELMDKGFKKEIDKKVSELRKEVIDLVLSKSPKEVKSAQGKEKLRKEITTRLNKCLIREGIKNTYFTEMVVL